MLVSIVLIIVRTLVLIYLLSIFSYLYYSYAPSNLIKILISKCNVRVYTYDCTYLHNSYETFQNSYPFQQVWVKFLAFSSEVDYES